MMELIRCAKCGGLVSFNIEEIMTAFNTGLDTLPSSKILEVLRMKLEREKEARASMRKLNALRRKVYGDKNGL